jgi:hypothetical protein
MGQANRRKFVLGIKTGANPNWLSVWQFQFWVEQSHENLPWGQKMTKPLKSAIEN